MRKRDPRIKELRTREDKSLGLDETYQDGWHLTHFTYSVGVKTQWKSETAGSAEIQVKTKREGERECKGNGSYLPSMSLADMLTNHLVNEIWINSVFLKRKKKILGNPLDFSMIFQYILYSADLPYSDFIDIILNFELICVCTHVCMHHTHFCIY